MTTDTTGRYAPMPEPDYVWTYDNARHVGYSEEQMNEHADATCALREAQRPQADAEWLAELDVLVGDAMNAAYHRIGIGEARAALMAHAAQRPAEPALIAVETPGAGSIYSAGDAAAQDDRAAFDKAIDRVRGCAAMMAGQLAAVAANTPDVATQDTNWMLEFEGALSLLIAAAYCLEVPSALALRPVPAKLWIWQNFVGGRPEYWAFDNPFPINMSDGDPQTLGEPCGYALVKPSRNGRPDVAESEVLRRIAHAARPVPPPISDASKDCRTCEHSYMCTWPEQFAARGCVNGDQYQPTQPVRLWEK